LEAIFVPLKGKYLLIALVIVSITNIKCDSASIVPKSPLSNGVAIVQKLVVKNNKNVVEVFESLTTRF
jgi:hypothetical protein